MAILPRYCSGDVETIALEAVGQERYRGRAPSTPSTIDALRPSIRLVKSDRDSIHLETLHQLLRAAEGRGVPAVDLIRRDPESLPRDATEGLRGARDRRDRAGRGGDVGSLLER
jgi:hypothetical protein